LADRQGHDRQDHEFDQDPGVPGDHENASARITGWWTRKNGMAASATAPGSGLPKRPTRMPTLNAATAQAQPCRVNRPMFRKYDGVRIEP
jgi:hypothetical protein